LQLADIFSSLLSLEYITYLGRTGR